MSNLDRGFAGAPAINLVTLLVPLAVMTGWLGVRAAAPDPAPPAPPQVAEAPVPHLDLRVAIGAEGYRVTGVREVLPFAATGADGATVLPCLEAGCPSASDYDVEGLVAVLQSIKDHHPTQDQVTLVPAPHVPYGVIVATMNVLRGDHDQSRMFPYIVIASAR